MPNNGEVTNVRGMIFFHGKRVFVFEQLQPILASSSRHECMSRAVSRKRILFGKDQNQIAAKERKEAKKNRARRTPQGGGPRVTTPTFQQNHHPKEPGGNHPASETESGTHHQDPVFDHRGRDLSGAIRGSIRSDRELSGAIGTSACGGSVERGNGEAGCRGSGVVGSGAVVNFDLACREFTAGGWTFTVQRRNKMN